LTDLFHSLIERFGLIAVFAGCLAEGESAAIFGGFFAHQQIFVLWQTVAVAFIGAFLGDTGLFLAGRRFCDHPRVMALRSRPGFSHAHGLIERHPDLFILTNRYIYGLRTAGGIAVGLSSVSVTRFLVLNAASAAVWAVVFVSVGYFFGLGAERLVGNALMEHQRLLIGIGLAVVVGLGGLWVGRRYLRRRD
jgi:membrane protein DedA with SNARE-associated domain